MAARHEEDFYQNNVFKYFLVCKELSAIDIGVTMVTVYQEMRPGAGFKTGDFAKENFGELP